MSDEKLPVIEPSAPDCGDALRPPPDVSVVIVNWNVAKLLADCLDSLARTAAGLVLEVWVVDNASSDDSAEMVRTRYPWVRLIANEDNRGFARANNQAIRRATGRYVFILNPDTIVEEGAIQALTRFLDEHPDTGMVGPRMVDAEGNIDPTCARRFYTLSAALWTEALRFHNLPWIGPRLFRRLMCPYDFSKEQAVEAISGAAMVVRRELIQRLDGFDEVFRHCGEDLDLCCRIHAASQNIFYIPNAVVVHLGGKSAGQAPLRSIMNAVLSNIEYFARYRGRFQAFLYRCMIQCLFVPQWLTVGLWKRLVGKESSETWRLRLATAWHILTWRKPQ